MFYRSATMYVRYWPLRVYLNELGPTAKVVGCRRQRLFLQKAANHYFLNTTSGYAFLAFPRGDRQCREPPEQAVKRPVAGLVLLSRSTILPHLSRRCPADRPV